MPYTRACARTHAHVKSSEMSVLVVRFARNPRSACIYRPLDRSYYDFFAVQSLFALRSVARHLPSLTWGFLVCSTNEKRTSNEHRFVVRFVEQLALRLAMLGRAGSARTQIR